MANIPHSLKIGAHRVEVRSRPFYLLMFAVGIAWGALFGLYAPQFLRTPDLSGLPRWASFLATLEIQAQRWPWGLLTVAAVLALLWRMRLKPRAWILIIVVGALVGEMAVELWHKSLHF